MNNQTGRLPRFMGLLLLAWWAAPPAGAALVTGRITDFRTGEPLPARLYVRSDRGSWHFAESSDPARPAVRYAKTNWINPDAVECHVTLPAAPFRVDLPPGKYTLIVERGKEYRPLTQQAEVATQPVELSLRIRRWIRMAERGWFSGETHIHRTPAELTNVVLAEDLNVTFPLSFWVTQAFAAPGAGDRNMAGDFPARPLYADSTHAIWPRNTEYEIFTVGDRPHALGALFLLNHRSVFASGVPPWGPIAAQARAEGALLDMDKLDWAFAFLLPPVTGAQLYELANNHMWRTEYAFTNYVSFAPPYLHPPYGSPCGSERDWTLYTLGMYYTLLNAGFRSVPAAGTASGVHPVPAGFSRVYVHLPDGFSYEKWVEGLAAGRSFVTTGPMLFAQVNERLPGDAFHPGTAPACHRVRGTVVSEEPLAFIEVLHNGIAVRTIMPQNREGLEGSRESSFDTEITTEGSGWLAVRCWEERPGGRFRWAHTAPWHIEVPDKPLRPRAEEKAFLIERMRFEIERSRDRLPPEAQAENERALAAYERLQTEEEDAAIARTARAPRSGRDLRDWLENMIWHHGFTTEEVRAATGLTSAEVQAAQERHGIHATNRPTFATDARLRVLPYPGGRHPRTGFLDGALRPQRDTKCSVFTPWDDRSYVVVDVPEALWSNLGLTYLAHEHVDTIWTKTDTALEPMEWSRHADGSLDFERTLPNGIVFGTRVVPGRDAVRMESWLRNGTTNVLTGLRLQNCVMLKAAKGFHAQTGQNKVLRAPYAACRSEDGRRWIITAWDPLDGVWQNPPVPCMHSNGRLADCPPGQTVRARGWLSFYEGTNVAAEFERIEETRWRSDSQSPHSDTASAAASPDRRAGSSQTTLPRNAKSMPQSRGLNERLLPTLGRKTHRETPPWFGTQVKNGQHPSDRCKDWLS